MKRSIEDALNALDAIQAETVPRTGHYDPGAISDLFDAVRDVLIEFSAPTANEAPEPARSHGCTCPTECDCQSFERGMVSNECPIHNDNPRPCPDCPEHGDV